MKNFALIHQGDDIRLSPAYDLLNTGLHVNSSDFALDGGLAPDIEKSDVYDRTGHPCRLDFERFGARIGVRPKRLANILDKFSSIPELTETLVANSFLTEKNRRIYLRSVAERISRFNRRSE